MALSIHPDPSARIIVGMSGGVDSSVTALLLKKKGYAVEGLFMKNWDEDDGTDLCTAKDDYFDALSVAGKIGIPLHIANFASAYWDLVFKNFLLEYQRGNTPNPDILCNKEIKFKTFLAYAKTLGADYIATGHYAKTLPVMQDDKSIQHHLFKGIDLNKDQSYFLYALEASQLQQTLFPLGDLTKKQVRQIACEAGLPTANKKDSTGICFIGKRPFRDFLKRYLSPKPGLIKNTQGQVIGEHEGLMYYTLGQRQGLHIGGVKGALEAPWYVVDKDMSTQALIVAQGHHHPALFSDTLTLSSIHWINQKPWPEKQAIQAKIRYRQTDQLCYITTHKTEFIVHFEQKQRAITPGQSIVFYGKNRCLGGAIIDTVQRN
ncbi:MAG: tRNA 2-thiouridine(34) synthase MnmA [Endozoicomonadaceae bacterium]|nr:tRNA 2-thiouridine(34) synthase MnmA [Endozoicomonadaceae bacterium]